MLDGKMDRVDKKLDRLDDKLDVLSERVTVVETKADTNSNWAIWLWGAALTLFEVYNYINR